MHPLFHVGDIVQEYYAALHTAIKICMDKDSFSILFIAGLITPYQITSVSNINDLSNTTFAPIFWCSDMVLHLLPLLISQSRVGGDIKTRQGLTGNTLFPPKPQWNCTLRDFYFGAVTRYCNYFLCLSRKAGWEEISKQDRDLPETLFSPRQTKMVPHSVTKNQVLLKSLTPSIMLLMFSINRISYMPNSIL